MMSILLRAVAAIVLAVASSSVMAANGFDPQQLFFGAGISQNEVPRSDDGTGFQVFGGYRFGELARNILVDAEVGYMDTGSMDLRVGPPPFGGGGRARAKGLWGNGVLRFVVTPQVQLLARAGLDLGDDDGLMVGVGAGFNLSRDVQMRLEYVERDNVDSLQLNFAFKP